MFEYRVKQQTFIQLPITDEENLAEKVPKNFKSVYLGGEAFFIAGGFDQKMGKTSKRAYLLTKGKITEILEMIKSRQFFTMVFDANAR